MGNLAVWQLLVVLLAFGLIVGYAYLSGWVFTFLHNLMSSTRVLSIHRTTWALVLTGVILLLPSVLFALMVPSLLKSKPEAVTTMALSAGLWVLLFLTVNPLIIRGMVPTNAGPMKKRYAYLSFYGTGIVMAVVGGIVQLAIRGAMQGGA